MGAPKKFSTISNEILRSSSKILDLSAKIQKLFKEALQWRGSPNEPEIAEMKNIIIRITVLGLEVPIIS